ncbi:MAG: SDR family oxidoreductase [Proteobacteria bacterium]|nr:SDR family oxidoreductase [Pseudomonadota bacterium]
MREAPNAASLFDLTGRVAFVTGGSSGIGRRMALALAAAGADVVIGGRDAGALADAKVELEATGRRAASVQADITDIEVVAGIAAEARKPFGDPHILVNAAGINLRESTDEITPESWQKTIDINLSVPFFLGRELATGMIKAGYGRIINIASLQTFRAFPNSASYGASKGGVGQLTRAMAEAWSKDGITVNAIAPGFFKTKLSAPVFADPAIRDANAARTMIGRNGELSDLDGTTIFLAAPASGYITGQIIAVDGGFTAK